MRSIDKPIQMIAISPLGRIQECPDSIRYTRAAATMSGADISGCQVADRIEK